MSQTPAEKQKSYRERKRLEEKLPPHLKKLVTEDRPRFSEEERNQIRKLVADGEIEVPPEGFQTAWGKPGWYPNCENMPPFDGKAYAARMTDYGRKPWIGGSIYDCPRPNEDMDEVIERRHAAAAKHGVALGWVRADGTLHVGAMRMDGSKPLNLPKKPE